MDSDGVNQRYGTPGVDLGGSRLFVENAKSVRRPEVR